MAMLQIAYRIQVAGDHADFGAPIWDTGRVESNQSVLVPYEGPDAASRSRYHYRVKAWDNFGRESEWSEAAWWETAVLNVEEWKAQWITPASDAVAPQADQAFMLRKSFTLGRGSIQSARIYATGAGVYELYLNGEKLGDDLFAPGWI